MKPVGPSQRKEGEREKGGGGVRGGGSVMMSSSHDIIIPGDNFSRVVFKGNEMDTSIIALMLDGHHINDR